MSQPYYSLLASPNNPCLDISLIFHQTESQNQVVVVHVSVSSASISREPKQ